ncbi:YjbH domain-containing protein [Idiomarina xiamenensis]|uniref:YjbH domain-containing protein n=1 Tax=Idiomarina xiamenensis 10-D-4 TaxID=740709 RepID=K2K3E6_9GAMM|nr:YjbH domain-containing protein [Idiomarina xiamenensis]EKE82133.1 hypothetical protein A10D4_10159 [Idiomarina xiamenensis 10-D-4]
MSNIMQRRRLATAIALFACGFSASSYADWWEQGTLNGPSQSDIGGVGLMQMPTGRMAREGEFSFTYYDNEEYRRWALSLQLFPWLETTIRYNDVRTKLYSQVPEFSGDQTYKDRGIDIKLRLLEESLWLPELSVGVRDLAGTGYFAGEFIAGSKRIGPFDLTLGMGWGYLGTRDNLSNPFCEVSDSFCDRPSGLTGTGGDFEVDKWFKGDSAIFGGVEYQTPWQPLRLKVEFDGNDYSRDRAGVPIKQDSPWNYGAEYAFNDNLKLKLSYERGNTWMFGFTFRLNFDDAQQLKVDKPPRPAQPTKTQSVDDLRGEQAGQALAKNMADEAGFNVNRYGLSNDGKVLTLYGGQRKYRNQQEALERSGRVLASEVPDSIETYELIDQSYDMELGGYRFDADTFKTAIARADLTTQPEDAIERIEARQTEAVGDWLYNPMFEVGMPNYALKPFLEQSVGGPEDFFMYQIGLENAVSWSLADNFNIYGRVGVNLTNNFDKFNYLVEGGEPAIPRVRTYVREYVTMSDVWLDNLQATWANQLSPNWYQSLYGGYLERMFGGVGGEILYRPLDSNLAIGLNVAYARQRSFENHFGFRDYDVVTGHLTAYWKTQFLEDSLITVSAGRFLAKDLGVNINFQHEFDSGIIAGAYASFTDVSSEDFGEGSFTKGFYISIPFDMFSIKPSVGRGAIAWSPLTRDGGQMLGRVNSLYGITSRRSND